MKKDEYIKELEKELRNYRKLGTVKELKKELKKLRKKSTALAPILGEIDKFSVRCGKPEVRLRCPACNQIVMEAADHSMYPACGSCGQFLDWDGVDWSKKENLEMEERSRLEQEG